MVLLLELLLIKDLYGEDAVFVGAAAYPLVSIYDVTSSPCSQIKALVPVRVQRPLDNGSGLGLLSAEGRHCEGIWKPFKGYQFDSCWTSAEVHTEYVTLVESIGSNN